LIRYIARRLAFALFLVMAVSSASLLLSRLAPGDFVTESLGTRASRQAIDQQRARFGLNR
jgi:ABC-type dipeptide/oligopeptide/nickel transport system permease component